MHANRATRVALQRGGSWPDKDPQLVEKQDKNSMRVASKHKSAVAELSYSKRRFCAIQMNFG